MSKAICRECATDRYLKKIIEEANERLLCSHCQLEKQPAISAQALAAAIEPVMREQFSQGSFDHDGNQGGDSLETIIYEVIGQELDFVDEFIDEVIALDPAWPPDGDEPLWERHACYVSTPVGSWEFLHCWSSVLEELKHSRRFFNSGAAKLFADLFEGIVHLSYWDKPGHFDAGWKPVVYDIPSGSQLFRARICTSDAQRAAFFAAPLIELGPPPPQFARAGRMNAEGVPVLYCALDSDTAIAEMRPAIGTELVVATFQTTKPIRVLDFGLLEKARGEILSYLQPDFQRQLEKNHFLKRLHRLISQPIVPGREADYIITQTLAEYLAHVVDPQFGGVLFGSAQHEGGKNVVLFSQSSWLMESHEAFSIEYKSNSIAVHEVRAVKYRHSKLESILDESGNVSVYDPDQSYDEDDDTC